MAPRRFRVGRIGKILQEDPTGTVELVVAFCYVVIPGVGLILQRVYLPPMTSDIFAMVGFTEPRMGLWALLFGMAQIWGAGTHWYAARALIATILGASLTALVVAYWFTGYFARPTFPLMIGTIISQMFIAWRCWHERPPHVRVQ